MHLYKIFPLILMSAVAHADTTSPFCPCFSLDEINTSVSAVAVECFDDRYLDDGAGVVLMQAADGSVVSLITGDAGTSWQCQLRTSGDLSDLIVSITGLGLADAMACRLAIIESKTWKTCQ